MLIACDIGGVVKEMINDNPIPNSIETIKELEKLGNKVIFVSKCKQHFREILKSWLLNNDLLNDVFFCNEYCEKNEICIKQKVDYMIDDKLQVFRDMPDNIKKIWLCSDYKKIAGANKYQPDELSKVIICNNWDEISQKS
jgi:uncharacterized HAD superfamily protein